MNIRPPHAAPLRADFAAVRARPSDTIVRDIVAKARSRLDAAKPDEGAMRTRAASTPATTTQVGWAAELAASTTADLVVGDVSLGPGVAAITLFRRSLRLTFGRSASIVVPTIVMASSGLGGFVGEDQPIAVRQYLFRGPRLTPHKLAIAVALSNEMFMSGNAATYIRGAMSEGISADLDVLLFDANPATAIRPAGLRNGVSGLTPTAGGTDGALTTDLVALITAVKPVAGSQIALVCSPDNYLKLLLRPNSNFPYPILESSGLPAKTVLAVAVNALAVAFGDEPSFTISDSATYHMEDTTPQQLVAAGTPPVVAAPRCFKLTASACG